MPIMLKRVSVDSPHVTGKTGFDTLHRFGGAARDCVGRFYPEVSFGGFTRLDGTVAFYNRVNALIEPSSVVVDFGCGRGSADEDPVRFRRDLQRLRGKAARVIGLDLDPAGRRNPNLDEFHRLAEGGPWPIDGHSVDLIVCDCVIEHLPDPPRFFAEARRVLARNGYVCIRTPNRLGYVGLISRLVPERHHTKLLSKAQPDRQAQDTFPAFYRCNTIAALRKNLAECGFRAVVYGYEPEPGYLGFSSLAYRAGVLNQKLVPSAFRNVIFAFGQVVSSQDAA